mmetsp:Transcript_8045/g.25073  ORF Transcript_8045/g.25073 Transcript_8045/m.25073 type:complete len:202 (+) Transcript_8045:1562-2167(+)|eukprot:scaffold180443_cov31-Tisochrysis_lutea.AAC.2
MAWPIMYRPPSLGPPPLPHTRCRFRPSGYISLRNMAENMPGPGSGNPSFVGLKASSAVHTNSAPCERRYDAILMIEKDQSGWLGLPVFGSTDAEMEPSEKSTTNTHGCSRCAAAIADHSLASSSDRWVRISHELTSSIAASEVEDERQSASSSSPTSCASPERQVPETSSSIHQEQSIDARSVECASVPPAMMKTREPAGK